MGMWVAFAICSGAHWSASVAVPPTMRQPKRSTILSRFTSFTKSRRGGCAQSQAPRFARRGGFQACLDYVRLSIISVIVGVLIYVLLACIMQAPASSGLRRPDARSRYMP